MTKQEFLNKYNTQKKVEVALSKCINASVQHNKLYLTKDNKIRFTIRKYWKSKLYYLYKKWRKKMCNEIEFVNEVILLAKELNSKFPKDIFLKISHSQKSISLFFKHLWCMEKISTPPLCPVDRKILKESGAPADFSSWTHINDRSLYMDKINFLKSCSINDGYSSLALWELNKFN